MKRLTLFCIITAFFVTLHAAQPKHELRAVWLTTIGGIDWPSTYAHDGVGVAEQKRQLTDMLDKLAQTGINTILLQTRIRATTIYPSAIEPWDGCLSGRPGQSPGYDALKFAIDECHRRGMELHAWVVTIPVGKWNSYGCQRLRRRYGRLIMKLGDEGYMNPESSITSNYLSDMCEEIVRQYDIDGIHLDYIRYPETWRGHKSAQHITNIVQAIHDKVKYHKPWVKVSCSPIGKYDDLSRYRSNGWNARSRVAQDAQSWLRMGIVDQLYPMIYFQGNQFYPFAIDWQENSFGRTVAAGIAVYMLHPREGRWQLPEVQRQLNVTRQCGMGHCFFRAKFLLDNVKGVYRYTTWFYRHPALIPPMTWQHSLPPTPPTKITVRHTSKGDQLTWSGATDRSNGPYLLYNIYASTQVPVDTDDPANLIVTRQYSNHLFVPARHGQHLHYAVTALDRYGNESMPCSHSSHEAAIATSLLHCNGNTLTVPTVPADAQYLAILTLQGTIVHTAKRQTTLDISILEPGIYQLKSLSRKGIAHSIGFFCIKR